MQFSPQESLFKIREMKSKALFLLLLALPTYSQIRKDWGISYDDYVKQFFTQLQIDYNNLKNEAAIQERVNGRTYQFETYRFSISYKKRSDKEGILYVKNLDEGRTFFIFIKATKTTLDPEEIKSFNLPQPVDGEEIRYNFNNSYQILWRKNPEKKFISIGKGNVLAVRFISELQKDIERFEINFFLISDGSQIYEFEGEVIQQQREDLPIKPTTFLNLTQMDPRGDLLYKEVSFLEFNTLYRDFTISILDTFLKQDTPLSFSSNQEISISISL